MLILRLVEMKVVCFKKIDFSPELTSDVVLHDICTTNFPSACLLLLCSSYWIVSSHLKRGVIQKSIARKQAHFSSLNDAAKIIFPEFAQVSLLAGLHEPAIIMLDLQLCDRRKLSH